MARDGPRRLVVALTLVGAVVLVIAFRRGASDAVPDGRREAPAAAASDAAAAGGGDLTVSLGITAAAGRPKPEIVPGGLARMTADQYRRRARYPRSSQPVFSPDDDPITRERVVNPVRSRGRRGEDPTLVVYPAQVGFETPEPAVVHAYLEDGDRREEAKEIRATVLTDQLETVGEIVYRDDGTDGDAEAGDGIYTAAFVPGPESDGRLSTSYMLQVRATTLGDEERFATTSFLYSWPDAQLTGAYRDLLVDGSLHVQAEVEVTAPGRFHLEGTLYDASGTEALAWAQTAAELPEGRHWMTLPFYGLILHERGIDGPYLVRNLALSTASAMPNAKNRVARDVHVTAAYRATQFTDAAFGDPDLLDAAERVERDAPALGGLEAGG